MKSWVFFTLFCLLFIAAVHGSETRNYIVYMGSSDSSASKDILNVLISSFVPSNKDGVVRIYQYGFLGFAARLLETQAAQLATHPSVVSVFPDPVLRPQTTRSWDFLEEEYSSYHGLTDIVSASSRGSGTIIGILDSGIWPESESFNDKSMDPIPSRWKGECMEAPDFKTSNCNKKLIGARYYNQGMSPRDDVGHGTHVAATAAGSPVQNVSFYGLASGTARSGAPLSHIAVYKVCDINNCLGSAVLAAFDDAIKDGVDVISASLGDEERRSLLKDPLSIGSLHAVQKGITVICSAGNDGPSTQSVYNAAPWIITVGATTTDRFFESRVILGDNTMVKGEGYLFSELKKSPIYELVDGSDRESSVCQPKPSAKKSTMKGKMVLCKYSQTYNLEELKSVQVVGLILTTDVLPSEMESPGLFPLTLITSKDGLKISTYINSSRNPVATILTTRTTLSHKPAPVVSDFSSRGPAHGVPNLIKPDIVAPGVQILAAWKANDPDLAWPGKEIPRFNLLSGTSMACPHVSGIVAAIKSRNPTWTPAVIKSAIMTSAIQTDNLNHPISTENGKAATPYDCGSGLVSPRRGLNPGLAYEIEPVEYLHFLCYVGYNLSRIKLIAGDVKGFSCPTNATIDMISNFNYPSIAASWTAEHAVTVKRTLSNTSSKHKRVYMVSVEAPLGLTVNVIPNKLTFTRNTRNLSYVVTFSSTTTPAKNESVYGAIKWTSGKFQVRTPFVLNLKA